MKQDTRAIVLRPLQCQFMPCAVQGVPCYTFCPYALDALDGQALHTARDQDAQVRYTACAPDAQALYTASASTLDVYALPATHNLFQCFLLGSFQILQMFFHEL